MLSLIDPSLAFLMRTGPKEAFEDEAADMVSRSMGSPAAS